MLDWSESAPAFKIAKQCSCLCIPFPFSNSHLAKNSLPREAFQATLGTGFEIFTICVKMHFSCSLQFPILSWNGFVARPKYYIYKWKIPSQLFSTFWNRFPFLRPTKMFTSGKSGSFLTLNSVWEKFLSPMIIWQCARFRNQPSFQSGALTGWRPYCALYLDIYVVGPVQPDGQACYKAGFWLGCSKSVVYTGGHNSYRSARDWLQVVTHRNPTHTVWVTMVGEASTRIWNRAIFKQG